MKISVLPADRMKFLIADRNRKMAASAHAYVRGSTSRFYQWLENSERSSLPEGPELWICGDCHVGNLGPVASRSGALAVQIRDLDQTVIGNPAHDLVRLALSLATAARSSDLPGVTTALMLERMMDGYGAAFAPEAEHETADEAMAVPKTVKLVMRQASRRSWKHLADERIEGMDPVIPLGSRFWPLTNEEHEAVRALFDTDRLRALVTILRNPGEDDHVKVVDAAYWRKGCSSLGRLRMAALVKVGRGRSARHCLMDIKEAVQASAPHAPDANMPADQGERVVMGARHLSPFLGTRMASAPLLGKSVFVRELLPQDLKLEIETLTRDEALNVAEFLAHVVGIAHARQLSVSDRSAWLAELQRNRSRALDAPSWLWNSTVDLVALHEAAYLQHCRRYAFEEKAA
ncbi:DUF2252 domain-containing protein [Neorhizobium lilium]|uniref:DUF2252 domain-containing protein n=1 Tax=Neorhizobium lilium TaxID=2503024 RepID=A0A3S3T318_9HYPH|nr:DUF2252 family protein [Neorhizobium lilium]RWX80949.1 DUF2252 domain-containing protein [Neorhizobium lilium]